MTYQEFLKLVDQTSNQFNWRYGQALMNVLHGVWLEKYNEIIYTNIDPYYNDETVPKALRLLAEQWESKNE
jgi:hypothetical protein